MLALAEPIKREFHLSDFELGLLTSLFAVSYSIAGLPVGMLVDRVSRVRLLSALLAAWSCMTGLGGLVMSFPALILARIGLAAGESGAVPTSMSLIADYFPARLRGTALGVYFFNNAIANAIGFTMAGYVAAHYGWRVAFFVAGAPGLILSVVALTTLREPMRGTFEAMAPDAGVRASPLDIVRAVFARPALLRLTIAAVSVIAIQAGTAAFITPFFIRIHHLSVQQAGGLVGAVFGIAFAVGTPAGGFISDRLSGGSARRGCRFLAVVTVLAAPLALAGICLTNTTAAVICVFLYMALIASYYPAAFATYLNLSPVKMRGALGAFLMILMNLMGYGVGPQIVGFLSDLGTHFGFAQPLRWAMALLECGLLPAGVLFFYAGEARQEVPSLRE